MYSGNHGPSWCLLLMTHMVKSGVGHCPMEDLFCPLLVIRLMNLDLCWTGIVFFSYEISNEGLMLLNTSRVYIYFTIVFFMPFRSIYHDRTLVPRKNYPSINMV